MVNRSKIIIFIGSILLAISVGQVFSISNGKCAKFDVIPNFDLNKYAGKWYEIERYDYIFEFNLECVTAEYAVKNSTHISVRNGGRNM